ncbi:hypothetical protein C0993_011200, partial [Termitomyces sp. T159_Od127]
MVGRRCSAGGPIACGSPVLPVGVPGGVPRHAGCQVLTAILPIPLVDLSDEGLVTVVAGLLGGEAEDVLDALRQGMAKGKSESVVVPAGFIGLLLESDDEDGEPFIVAHPEVEE